MNQPSIAVALAWKDFRQIRPLILTVLGLGFLLNILFVAVPPIADRAILALPFVFLVIPMVFATGVGVLLVGHEKDQRTLGWLRTHPIPAQRIASSKLFVSCGSLLMVWIASLLIDWIMWQFFVGVQPGVAVFLDRVLENPFVLVVFPCLSLFMTLAGLGLAWHCSSSRNALMMLIACCLMVLIVNLIVERFLQIQVSNFSDRVGWSMVWFTVVIGSNTLIALVLGWYASQRYLSPQRAPRSWEITPWSSTPWNLSRLSAARSSAARSSTERRRTATWSASSSLRTSVDALAFPIVPPTPALVWQFAIQNRLTLIAVLGFLVVAIASTAAFPFSEPYPAPMVEYISPYLQLLIVLAWIACCWLGCTVFQGDNLGDRIRFLADRGVSPGRVWWSRVWIPIVLIVLACSFRMGMRALHAEPLDRTATMLIRDFFLFLGGGLAIVIACQWLAQCIKSTVVSSVVAPIFVFVLLIYGMFCVLNMEAPWWLLPAPILLLGIATRLQMKAWMDRALNRTYYAIHGSFLATGLLIPILPGLWSIMTLPSMPQEIRRELEEKTLQVGTDGHSLYNNESIEVRFNESSGIRTAEYSLRFNDEKRARKIENIKHAVHPLKETRLSRRDSCQFLLSELTLSRTALDFEPSDAHRDRYRELFAGTLTAIEDMRAAHRLKELDLSEMLEIALLREFRSSSIRIDLGDALHARAIAILADASGRDESRRRALAADWSRPKSVNGATGVNANDRLGGYYLGYQPTGSFPAMARVARRRDLLISKLWKLLRAKPGNSSSSEHRALSSFERDSRITSDSFPGFVWVDQADVYGEPGMHWRGEWEIEASELADRLTADTNASP